MSALDPSEVSVLRCAVLVDARGWGAGRGSYSCSSLSNFPGTGNLVDVEGVGGDAAFSRVSALDLYVCNDGVGGV